MTQFMMRMIPYFESEDEARAWLVEVIDDPCTDDPRIAYLDEPKQLRSYADETENGCCGQRDCFVVIQGRPAIIGTNFGH